MLTRCPIVPLADGVTTEWHDVAPFDELVVSWTIDGERDCAVRVQCSGEAGATPWFVMAQRCAGRWSSVPGQEHDGIRADVDVLVAETPLRSFCVRVDGEQAVRLLAVDTSLPAEDADDGEPVPGEHLAPCELAVEPLSQMAHADVAPELDGGGRSWCSPTSLAMVLRFHGLQAEVPDVARAVFDPVYGGCGSWSANVAYAGARGLDAVVVRLDGMRAAEALVRDGIPLVVSIAARPGELPGFPLPGGTTGHLVVLSGFTAEGDPIVLDPAAARREEVRRVYPRAVLDGCWRRGSRRTAYVVGGPAAGPPTDAGA